MYRFMTLTKMLKLPCYDTLRRYYGRSYGETGITTLIKLRLKIEAKRLCRLGKMGSLIIDEMSIKPSQKYLRNIGQYIGFVDLGSLNEVGLAHKLANKMLTFVFQCLSKPYAIPVAYFPVKDLTGEQLHALTLEVIRELEALGFQVVR